MGHAISYENCDGSADQIPQRDVKAASNFFNRLKQSMRVNNSEDAETHTIKIVSVDTDSGKPFESYEHDCPHTRP